MKHAFMSVLIVLAVLPVLWANVFSVNRVGAEDRIAYYYGQCAKHHVRPQALHIRHCALGWYIK